MANMNHITKIAIPDTVTKNGVVFYRVSVQYAGDTWICDKRYSKFEELNSNLLKSKFVNKIPTGCELPGKKWKMITSHSSPQFVEKRRMGLENYLQRLISVKELVSSQPIEDFVKSDKVKGVSSPEGGGGGTTQGNSETTEDPAASAPFESKTKAKNIDCTCGFPLCVCQPEEDEKKEEPEVPKEKPKEPDHVVEKKDPEPVVKIQNPSIFAGFASKKKPYDLEGDLNEQCRDAIKAGDEEGVKSLLEAKADPKYQDRTGHYLVHMAAMFNREGSVKMLVEGKADIWCKNPSDETAVDLAPEALGHKMKLLQPKSSVK